MKKFMEERDITYLVHFTRCSNLKSIFEHGLLPRQYLIDDDIEFSYTDDYRLDGFKDATCVSITFPNYKMFYPLKCNEPDEDWAVLGIHADVLLEYDCAFCKENAASNYETSIPIEYKKGLDALKELFEDYPPPKSRVFLGIDDNMTTNPQSEVLVFNKIEVDKIFGVAFIDSYTKDEYINSVPSFVDAVVNKNLFYGRNDFEFWR